MLRVVRSRMGLRPIRLLAGQWPTKPVTGTGFERRSPEMDTETRVQALRGASGAETSQCAKA